MFARTLTLTILITFTVACSPVAPLQKNNVKESNDIMQTLVTQTHPKPAPTMLNQAALASLMPPVTLKNTQLQKRFDINVKDMPLNEFVTALMHQLGQSVIVDPTLTTKVTLSLDNVTLAEVLQALQDTYDIHYQKMSYGYRISLPKLETKAFVLSHLNLIRKSVSNSEINSVDLSNHTKGNGGTSTSLSSNTDDANFWAEIKASLKGLLAGDSKASFSIDQNTGVIMVTALPSTLKQVSKYIQTTQDILNREVVIEAKIIEIQLNRSYETGIEWNKLGFSYNSLTGTIRTPSQDSSFTSVIKLLSTQGRVTVLSSPRVVTLNNQQALIKVGKDRYFVTNVNSDTTPIGQTATLSSNVDLQPFFSGIALQVLPEISMNGEIRLFIHPIISQVEDDTRNIELSKTQTLNLPLAQSSIRETDNIVRVKSGQFIILGGLMQSTSSQSGKGLPLLDRHGIYPDNDDNGEVDELLIILRAYIPDQETWAQDIKNFKERYNHIDKEGYS